MWSSAVMILQPRRASSSCTLMMPRSLPGIMRDEKITVSPSPSAMLGWVSAAILASALRGSPWLPVQMMQSESSGRKPASSSGTKGSMPFR